MKYKLMFTGVGAFALGATARLRFNASACSHAAMPCAARLLNMYTAPNARWAKAWSGGQPKYSANAFLSRRRLGPTRPPKCRRACNQGVAIYGSALPGDRFLIAAELHLGDASHEHPMIRQNVSRTKPQRFNDVALGFLGAPKRYFSQTDGRRRPATALCSPLLPPQRGGRRDQWLLSCWQRGYHCQGALEKFARLRRMLRSQPLIHASHTLEIKFHRIRMWCQFRPARLGGDKLCAQLTGEPRNDFVLHVEEVGQRLVEALGQDARRYQRR